MEPYIKFCLVCEQDKVLRQKETRLLQHLVVLERPWVLVLMDFIMGFLKVEGMKIVMVIVDRFLKSIIFMATPAVCTTKVDGALFYKHVKYFGVSSGCG